MDKAWAREDRELYSTLKQDLRDGKEDLKVLERYPFKEIDTIMLHQGVSKYLTCDKTLANYPDNHLKRAPA